MKTRLNFQMGVAVLFSCFFSTPVFAAPVGALATEVLSAYQLETKKIWLGVGFSFLPLLRAKDGKKFEVGYQRNHWGLDMRGLSLASTYSRFAVSSDEPPEDPPTDEWGDPIPLPPPENQPSDLWSGTIYDFGLSYLTRAGFLGLQFQERTRVGLCLLGKIHDGVNPVSYRPSLFSVENDVEFRIFRKFPLKIQVGLNWRFGYLIVTDPMDRVGNRIPSSTLSFNTGLLLEF